MNKNVALLIYFIIGVFTIGLVSWTLAFGPWLLKLMVGMVFYFGAGAFLQSKEKRNRIAFLVPAVLVFILMLVTGQRLLGSGFFMLIISVSFVLGHWAMTAINKSEKKKVIIVGAFSVALLVGGSIVVDDVYGFYLLEQTELAGEDFPDFNAVDTNGASFSKADLTGKVSVVVVGYKACDCCDWLEERTVTFLDKVDELDLDYKDPEINFIAFNLGTDSLGRFNTVASEIQSDREIAYWFDKDLALSEHFKYKANPNVYILDENGVIVKVYDTFEDSMFSTFEERIKEDIKLAISDPSSTDLALVAN